jgi:endonuclease/exonuclease/phosphatase family metal-dependent hydrolase
MRIASFNVENLFDRPKALNGESWEEGKPVLDAYHEVNGLFQKAVYTVAVKERIIELLVELDIYTVNDQGAVRRKQSQSPRWAWMRKNRGSFDREPTDASENVEIIAEGRGDWIGWVELATEPVTEAATRMTARVIQDVAADVIGIVEAEDRPALVRFNKELLGGFYEHIMLVDGNDERGIDVAILTRDGFKIESIRSNVDTEDDQGQVFSRDCAQYEVRTPAGNSVHVLINHFKSQSGGGGAKRKRQAKAVRKIVDELVAADQHVVVLGDLNEGPAAGSASATNLAALYNENSPLVECYSLPGFEIGSKPGSFNDCGLRNRLDYVFISESLRPHFVRGQVFRKGLWGMRQTRPTAWGTYPEMADGSEQASDHSALVVEVDV